MARTIQNPKTKFAEFVKNNFAGNYNKFARAVNEWYGFPIVRIYPLGGNLLGDWGGGRTKPRQMYEVWTVVKKYIRAVFALDVDDSWLKIRKIPGQEQQNIDLFSKQEQEQEHSVLVSRSELLNEYDVLRKRMTEIERMLWN